MASSETGLHSGESTVGFEMVGDLFVNFALVGSPTTSQIEFSVSNWRACCPDLWQSLWGCHRVQFSGRLFSLYTSMMLVILCSTILYTSVSSLDTVLTNLQTSFNAIQHSFRGLNSSKMQAKLNTCSSTDHCLHPLL